MVDLVEAMDAFDRMVATAAETVPDQVVEKAALVGRRVRNRRGYLGSTVVVALAGGTGSGKSSMINALAGEEVVETGALRPTTSEPLAWIPFDPEPGVVRLLDDIGIEARVGQAVADWLAVIDLPDTDSVAVEHRQTVARLLPEVDVVVWVLDPEKYQDRVLHNEHLAPLAQYADRFLFALNQIDRLAPDQVPVLIEDLRVTLVADGIPDPVILGTAADPAMGPELGIEELVQALRDMGDIKVLVRRKLLKDLAVAAQELASSAGVAAGTGTGFSGAWELVLAEVSDRVTSDVVSRAVTGEAQRLGRTRYRKAMTMFRRRGSSGKVQLSQAIADGPGSMAAIGRIDEFVAELAGRVEGDTAIGVRQVGENIDSAVSSALQTIAYGETVSLPPPPGWTAAVAWFRRIAMVAALVSGVWLYDAVQGSEELLRPFAVTLVAAILVLIPMMVGGEVGGREAAAVVVGQRAALARAVSRELDRRLGRGLREVLRKRAGLAAALAELQLVLGDSDEHAS